MDILSCKKKTAPLDAADEKRTEPSSGALPNSVMESIARGSMAPTSAMLGQRETLAPSLQEKMQGAFGADFSSLEVYRSETAKSAGMLGAASGNKVALSPDIDLNSHAGQAVLGHELSHVVAQSKGIGASGRGLMETPSLERQAMIEGERAASGMRAFAGDGLSSMDTAPGFSFGLSEGSENLTPISATTGAFGMGAPMQGKFLKPDSPKDKILQKLNSNDMSERLAGQDEFYQDDAINMILGSKHVTTDPEVKTAFDAADDKAMQLSGDERERYVDQVADMFITRAAALADVRASKLAASGGNERKADKAAMLTPEATAFRGITALQQASMDSSLIFAITEKMKDNPELTAKVTMSKNLIANEKLMHGADKSAMFASEEEMKYWTGALNKGAKRSLTKGAALPKKIYNPEEAVQWTGEGMEHDGRKPGENAYDVWQRLRLFKRDEALGDAVTRRLDPNAPLVPGTQKLSRGSYDRPFEGSKGKHALNLARLVSTLGSNVGHNLSKKHAADMVEDLAAGKKGDPSGDERLERGMRSYKKLLHEQLLRLQSRYGTMLSQMHPEDVLNSIDMQQFGSDTDLLQDMMQLDDRTNQTGVNVVDPENPKDKEFIKLREYYHNAVTALAAYSMATANTDSGVMGNESQETTDFVFSANDIYRKEARALEGGISGPNMDEKQLEAYKKRSQKRLRDSGHSDVFTKRFWE